MATFALGLPGRMIWQGDFGAGVHVELRWLTGIPLLLSEAKIYDPSVCAYIHVYMYI